MSASEWDGPEPDEFYPVDGVEEEERPMAQQNNTKPKYKNKPNHGSMFENDRKQDGDTKPDFRGDIDIEGVTYWISGWKAMTTSGKKRISLSVQRQEERPKQNGDDEGWGGNVPQQRQQPKRTVSGW